MPLPTPHKGEKQNDFMGRCVPRLTDMKEGKDNEQRVAICFSQFKKAKAEELAEEAAIAKELEESWPKIGIIQKKKLDS